MRRSRFLIAAFLVGSVCALAQHSSGGGGGGGGGGGHSGGGSSSSGSSGGHSSGGSGGHASSGSGSHSASGSSSSRSNAHGSSSFLHPAGVSHYANGQPEKRGFFFFLHHHHPAPPAVIVPDYRRRICPKGGCPTPTPYRYYSNTGYFCSRWGFWGGAACRGGNYFDECAGMRSAMAAQLHRMQAAESSRQSACAMSGSEECSSRTSIAQSEGSLYRQFQLRYQQCMQRYGGFAFGTIGARFGAAGGFLTSYDTLSPEPWMSEAPMIGSWGLDLYH